MSVKEVKVDKENTNHSTSGLSLKEPDVVFSSPASLFPHVLFGHQ